MLSKSVGSKFQIIVLILHLICSTSGSAATYYLDTNGDDSNPGTRIKSWKSLQESIWKMKAGDTLIVKRGTYNAASFADIPVPSKGKVTTIRADAGAEVVFDGRVPIRSVIAEAHWNQLGNGRWNISYSGNWKWLDGLWIEGRYYSKVKTEVELREETWLLNESTRQITIQLSNKKNPSDLKLEFRLGFMITFDTPYWNIEGITANYYTQYGIGIWKARNVTIRHCKANHNGGGGIEGVEAGNLLIENNHTSYNGAEGGPGWSSGIHLFNLTTKNNVVRRNLSHNNWDPSEHHSDGNGFSIDKGYSTGGAEVSENIAYENGGRGLDVMETSDTHVHHNTFYNNSLDAHIDNQGELSVYGDISLKGLAIADNILFATRKNFPLVIWNDLDAKKIKSDHNLLFNIDSPSLIVGRINKQSVMNYSLEKWRELSGHEVHSLNVDPKLKAPSSGVFFPLTSSPVIRRGSNGSTIGALPTS